MSRNVIILNGVSSSGKTTLAKAIQRDANNFWLHVAMDSFLAMLPDGRECEREWFPMIEVMRAGDTLPRIGSGPYGEALLTQMRQLVTQLAEAGFGVIVDEVADEAVIADYRRRLGTACLVVKVDAPLSELERRERTRGDRVTGLAREQSARIHQGLTYDLEVNTSADTSDAIACHVLETALA